MNARRIGALVAMTLGFAVVQLDVSVVNVATRSIGQDLGADVTTLEWVVNAYTIAFAALILSAGSLGDRLGAKRLFVVGFAVFTLASIGCAVAPDVVVLIGARVLQGMGAAILVPCSLTLINHEYAGGGGRARAVGIWAAGGSVALSVGPVIGGLLIAWAGWRSIFLINVPIGAIGLVLTLVSASETSRSGGRLDVPGQVLAILALGLLAAGIIQSGAGGGGASIIAALGIAVGLGCGVAFVIVERRSRSPMLPLGLFRSRTFAASTGVGLLINVAFYGLIFVFSLYFQTARQLSPLATGAAFAPLTIGVLATNLTAGRIVARIGTRIGVLAGLAAMAVGLAGILVVGARASYPLLVGPLVVLGLGLGAVVPSITAAQLGAVEPKRSGVASGTLNTARQTGSVIGVALMGALASSLGTSAGLRIDVLIGLALTIGAAAVALALPGRRDRSATTADRTDR